MDSISLNKFISSTGYCSRREADRIINAGRVTINGVQARSGNRVTDKDTVRLDGRILKLSISAVYLAVYKPKGVVSTTDPKEKQNIVRYVNYPERLFPVGRLDKDSEGLILMTNNGDIVNKILRAGNKHEKVYEVLVDKEINDEFIQRMSKGIPMLETVTKRCKVEKTGPKSFRITLIQGLNRQIRRMCEFLDYEVVKLKRVRIMNITLKNLAHGEWRILEEDEIQEIMALLSDSSNTKEASRDRKKKRSYKKKKTHYTPTSSSKKGPDKKNKIQKKRNNRRS